MSKSAEAFRTISEVADLLETPTHVLRFWESKFPQIKPVKRAGGRRYYRPADVALLSGIKRLLHDDGMTIRGVQKLIKEQGAKQISEGFEPEEEGAAADGAAAAPPESAPETAVEETPWQAAPTLETTGFAAPAEALEPAPEAAAEPAPPLAEEAPLGERLAQHPAEDLPEAGAPQEALWEEPAAAFETSGIAAPAEALEVSEAQPAAPEPAWEPPAAFESTSFPAPTEALDPATEPAPDPAPPLAEEPPLAERLAQHPVEALPEAHPPQEEPWEEPGAAFETSGIAAPAEALAPEDAPGAAAEPPTPEPPAPESAEPPAAPVVPRRGIWRQPSLFDPPEATPEADPEALIEVEAHVEAAVEAVVVEIAAARPTAEPAPEPVPEAPIALDVEPEEPDPLSRVVSLIIGGASPVSAPLAQAEQIDPRDDPLTRLRRELPHLDAGALSPIARMRLLSAHDRLVALRARLGQPPRPPRG